MTSLLGYYYKNNISIPEAKNTFHLLKAEPGRRIVERKQGKGELFE